MAALELARNFRRHMLLTVRALALLEGRGLELQLCQWKDEEAAVEIVGLEKSRILRQTLLPVADHAFLCRVKAEEAEEAMMEVVG